MDKDDVGFWLIFVGCAGLGLGYLVYAKVPTKVEESWWVVVSAIATAAGVVLSLYFSTKTLIDQRRHKRARGLLAGLFLLPQLTHLLGHLQVSFAFLTNASEEVREKAQFPASVLGPFRHPLLENLSEQEIGVISDLSDEVALHLAAAMSALLAEKKEMDEMHPETHWLQLPAHIRESSVRKWLEVVAVALLNVDHACGRLRELTGEERSRLLRLAIRQYDPTTPKPPITPDLVRQWVR